MSALTGVCGLALAVLLIVYLGNPGSIPRYRIETASTVFAAIAVASVLVRGRVRGSQGSNAQPPTASVIFAAIAFLSFWQALSIGLLSDDFVLLHRAAAGNVTGVSGEFFRPLPLAAWAVIARLGGGARTLHALNILLHATNAFLLMRVAFGWIGDRRLAVLAGLLLLVSPLSPEAVAWCSGVFDVSTTTFVLLLVLVARTDRAARTVWFSATFLLVAVAAVLSKETGAVAIAFVALDYWVRRRLPDAPRKELVIVAAVAGLYGGYRLLHASSMVRQPITKYVVQRWLFETIGAESIPWHGGAAGPGVWLAVIYAVAIVVAITIFAMSVRSSRCSRACIAGFAFALTATLPAMTFLAVAADLQGSRYVYLSSCGWALALATLPAGTETTVLRRIESALVMLLVALGAIGVRLHLDPWIQAKNTRIRVEQAASTDSRFRQCEAVQLSNLPDTVEGAYVFRNGALEAFADLGVRLTTGPVSQACSFAWSGERFDPVDALQPRMR